MPPEWILCLRHGEKETDRDGKEVGDGLSQPGKDRADQLADDLGEGRRLLPPGAGLPSAIFVPASKGEKHRRAFDTMEKLAASRKIQTDATIETKNVGELAERVLNSTAATVVVCWEHDALVAWLQRLAGKVSVASPKGWLPIEWEGNYDPLWRLQLEPRDGEVAYTFTPGRQGISHDEPEDHHDAASRLSPGPSEGDEHVGGRP